MSAVSRLRKGWGATAPYWVVVMAEQCDNTSQKRVAEMMDYSAATVSLVLNGTYTGDLAAIEQAVNGALLMATVACPVLGEIQAHRCLSYQRQKFAATNPTRVRLYKACRAGCPNSRINKTTGR